MASNVITFVPSFVEIGQSMPN